MSSLSFSGLVLITTKSPLDQARDELEDLAKRVPDGVDAGELTPVIMSMVGRLLDGAASVSQGLSFLASTVQATACDFQQTDAAASNVFSEGGWR